MIDADMLHHADGDDTVEAAGEFAIVALEEGDAVGDAGRIGALLRFGELFGGDVDRGDMHAEFGEIDGERPQPEPISATRMPGSSFSLAAMWRSLASCASSSEASGVGK